MKEDEFIINVLMDGVDIALRALEAHEVDLSPKQKNKQKHEEEDDYSLQTKWKFQRFDMEATSGGSSVRGSPIVHRESLRLMAKEWSSCDWGQGSSEKQ